MQKSGWLQKKSSGFLSRWQTRFVIVWDGFITIKHVPSKNKCKQFETVSAVKETDDKSFSVNCKDGKKLLLQCNSVAEREEWIAALVRGALEDMHGDGDVRQEQSNIDKEQTQEYENSGNLKQTPLEPSNSVISRNGREFRSLSYPSGQYVGEFQSGERHGMGRFEYHNGNVYIGSWNKDRKCGYGTLTWANNDQYRGDWKDNKMWGYGDFKYHNGNSYTGNFVADNKEGFGVEIWIYQKSCTAVYDSKPPGKFIWNNGDMYEGYWFQDEMSGEGTIKYINGNMYVGEMKSNLKSGKGRMRWASGDEYEGEWKAGVMNGIGRFSYAEDGLYDGAWLNDKRHGRGTMKYVNGDVYDGMWQNDMRQGEGRCEYANKDVFVGNFVANFREGWGVYTTAPVKVLMPDAALPKVLPGDEYSGNWHKDKKHGYGKYSWSDGDCYEGDWENDLRNNHGVCVYSNGESLDTWRDC
uniref:PH domain-containing protein n=1 Tax=Guillardia theta TaxID=55529 RepID=A0A7S4PGV1_GUITH|mmetsp:Transcript_50701/g.158394  ORF Transcript_50701/g.158394 Transcript_50701/m.158394 type:complete len:467 (+) Transcript_50701:161-1561(+)